MNIKAIFQFECFILLLHGIDARNLNSELREFGFFSTLGFFSVIDIATRWAKCDNFKKNMKKYNINGKIVLITGGNAGMGYETSLELAKHGGQIYMASRNRIKSAAAREQIKKESNNNNVFDMELDLASFDSIQKFVKNFKDQFPGKPRLDILINNAGIFVNGDRLETEHGLEMQIGINHFGHFLLTNLLLNTMAASGTPSDPARIITVSSVAHIVGKIHRKDLQLKESYGPWEAYGQSKLANILFTRELSRRIRAKNWPVIANALNPGLVDTNMYTEIGVLALPLKPFIKSPKIGALTSIMLAIDPSVARISGKYFADCEATNVSNSAEVVYKGIRDDRWLWEETERVIRAHTGLDDFIQRK